MSKENVEMSMTVEYLRRTTDPYCRTDMTELLVVKDWRVRLLIGLSAMY